MVIPIQRTIGEDGVNRVKRIDAIVDDKGNIVPTGMMIRKIGTEELYAEAVDKEDSGYVYEPTNIPIESEVEDLGLQQSDLSG